MELRAGTNTSFRADFDELIRAFAPYATLGEEDNIFVNITQSGDIAKISVTGDGYTRTDSVRIVGDGIKDKSEQKRLAKIMLYDLLCELTGRRLPYGSLTGIRPTKLYHQLLREGADAKEYFRDYLRVSESATEWIAEIVRNQEGIYSLDEEEIDLFVNIPICATRCAYCSFISAEYGRITKWIAPYVKQLVREIKHARALIAREGYILRSVYVGGGTPTSLSEEEFREIMEALKGLECREFTVEAGRPDTITREKLRAMADVGVSRISVNPQTFNDVTLDIIGRGHTSEDILRVYEWAREYPFRINMDLIAMLPGEGLEQFKYSVDKCISLRPENITVHTLAIKRGSNLKLDGYDNQIIPLATSMVDYSKDALVAAGYAPYYMYKQKYMSANLDNTGYALKGKECVYNIDIMEETHSIIACGAGGISKRVFHKENRLERLADPKGIDVYLEREDKILRDKEEFFRR